MRHCILGHIFPFEGCSHEVRQTEVPRRLNSTRVKAEALVSEAYLGPSVNEITNSE